MHQKQPPAKIATAVRADGTAAGSAGPDRTLSAIVASTSRPPIVVIT
jgi:hypothetical protein